MFKETMAPVMPGLLLPLLAIVFGTAAGMVFGLYEDQIKEALRTAVKAHPQIPNRPRTTLGSKLAAVGAISIGRTFTRRVWGRWGSGSSSCWG